MKIGDQIHLCRRDKHLSISELAVKTGISRNTLSAIENNKGNPTVEMLEKIAAALGRRVDINLVLVMSPPLSTQ